MSRFPDNICPHLLLNCPSLWPQGRGLGACASVHTHAHACTLCLCARGMRECTCLPGGRSAPPSGQGYAEIPVFCILTTSLYVGKLIWALGEGQCLQDSYPGRMSKDAGAPVLPFLRLGQVGSLNLARNIPEESVN